MNLIEFIYIFFPQAFQSHFQNGKENSYIVLSAREKMNLNWILGFISCCTDCEWEQEDSVSLPLSLHEIAHAEPVTARHENQAADFRVGGWFKNSWNDSGQWIAFPLQGQTTTHPLPEVLASEWKTVSGCSLKYKISYFPKILPEMKNHSPFKYKNQKQENYINNQYPFNAVFNQFEFRIIFFH